MCKSWLTGCVCVLPSARDADEREKWIHALEGTILRHTLQLRVLNSTLVSISAYVGLFVVDIWSKGDAGKCWNLKSGN